MDEYFTRSLKYEHLYQREIEQAVELAEAVDAYLSLYNEVRPHESLGQRMPLVMHCGDPHLFRGKVSKKLDTMHRVVISGRSAGHGSEQGARAPRNGPVGPPSQGR